MSRSNEFQKDELFAQIAADLNEGLFYLHTPLRYIHRLSDYYEKTLTPALREDFQVRWNDPEDLCHWCGSNEYECHNHKCVYCEEQMQHV